MTSLKRGKGLVNSLINKLPFEAHVPGYQYCGPGTNLKKRLLRGDPGINQLDAACKEHDIAYDKYKSNEDRTKADQKLSTEAVKRIFSKDSTLGERTVALAVATAMKTKIGLSKVGMGIRKRKSKKSKKCCTFKNLIKKTKKSLKNAKFMTKDALLDSAIAAAKHIKETNGRISQPRLIPIPKTGGVLPLIPIFAGLSALGSLVGGSAAVARAVSSANEAKRDLEESKRHNRKLEAIAIGNSKNGAGIYLKPYKRGYGLFLKPYPTSKNY